ncbi:MAG: glycosyltransferase family 4 protein, partial [Kangiellaceae bacterium]|nr:glycosyltransferase family 4 protein [Kangiellaceae bacterium]
KVNNVRSIRSVHGAPEHIASWAKPHKKFIHWLNRWSGRLLQQKVVSVSHELTGYLHGEFPKDKIVVVENGIDIEALDKFKHSPLLRLNNETINIGIVGRLVPVKRVDRFIQSAAIILKSLPQRNVIFDIFGDGPLKHQLESQAADLQVSENIRFHGHCSGSDIHKKIADLDLLLMTSEHEGLPMTLLESMFLGTPVICSSVGAIPHVLEQGGCGTLVENLSADAFASTITEAIENREQTLEKAQNAVQRVVSHYSASQNAKSFLKIYSDVTGFCHPELVDKIEGIS